MIRPRNLFLAFTFILLSQAAAFSIEEGDVIPGVRYFKFTRTWSSKKPVRIHVLKISIKQGVQVKLGLARGAVGRLQTTSVIARNNSATAAVNGTFFDKYWPHLPIGLIVVDGKLIMKSLLNRTAVGIALRTGEIRFGIPKMTGNVINISTGEKIPVFGINRPRKEGEIIIYTPEYGWKTKTNSSGVELVIEDNMVVGLSDGNSPIPRNGYVISFHGWTRNYANALPPGAIIQSNYSLIDGWDRFDQVITGGPRLLDNGVNVAYDSLDAEGFDAEVYGKNARTAIGVDRNGDILLVVAEGRRRRWRRQGAKFAELADLMKELGAVDAMCLDGGSSSTMYVNGSVVNTPTGGSQVGVSNAVIVKPYYRVEEIAPPQTGTQESGNK